MEDKTRRPAFLWRLAVLTPTFIIGLPVAVLAAQARLPPDKRPIGEIAVEVAIAPLLIGVFSPLILLWTILIVAMLLAHPLRPNLWTAIITLLGVALYCWTGYQASYLGRTLT